MSRPFKSPFEKFRCAVHPSLTTENFALPYNVYGPPHFLKRRNIPFIPINILFEFLCPKHLIGSGFRLAPPAIMPVPVATVNENNFVTRWKNKVWNSWQVSTMQTKPVTEFVKGFSNYTFGNSVLPSDMRHAKGSFGWC